MANPAAGHLHMPRDFLQRANAACRVRRPLINYGALLVSAAGSVIIIHTSSSASEASAASVPVPEYALVAFLLFLLGMSMVMLALVAEQFPGAAKAGVAIARALQHGSTTCSALGGKLHRSDPRRSGVAVAARAGTRTHKAQHVVLENQCQWFVPSMARPDDEPVFRGPHVGDRLERLFLNSGRILVLAGALNVISTFGNPILDGATAFLGLTLLLFGALLIMLSPLAHKTPGAAG